MKINPYLKPRNVKIGFLFKRGNAGKEVISLFDGHLAVQAELQAIDLYKVRDVFEKVMERPKKIIEKKKPGRPKSFKKTDQYPLNFNS
jgi:hypothetical protein